MTTKLTSFETKALEDLELLYSYLNENIFDNRPFEVKDIPRELTSPNSHPAFIALSAVVGSFEKAIKNGGLATWIQERRQEGNDEAHLETMCEIARAALKEENPKPLYLLNFVGILQEVKEAHQVEVKGKNPEPGLEYLDRLGQIQSRYLESDSRGALIRNTQLDAQPALKTVRAWGRSVNLISNGHLEKYGL